MASETSNVVVSSNVQTVAQALRALKELKGEHARLTERAKSAVHWTGEDEPVFDYAETVAKREAVSLELVKLKDAVARANAMTEVEFEGEIRSLQALVFLMAELKDQHSFLSGLSVGSKESMTEERRERGWDDDGRVTVVTTRVVHHYALTERQRVEQVDELRRRIGAIDNLLQSANHTTKVVLA